jgi:hypothetical protein
VDNGYCLGLKPELDHIEAVERPKTKERPFKSAVITLFKRWPEHDVYVRPPAESGKPKYASACAGVGGAIIRRVKLKRPVASLLKHPDPHRLSAHELATMSPIFLCYSIATITVEDSRVTIRSGLENDAVGRAAGEDFCLLMYSSDVADPTPGHELQGKNGEAIEVCPPSG